MRMRVRAVTATTFLAIAGIHVAWGRGSSFPFATHSDLTDAVVGRDAAPSPAACYGVAAMLTVAAGLAAGVPIGPRRFFAPLCLALAAGSATALRP
ncbi:MAG: DUF3995 domain-containing protein [Acidimicrobiia bacterium]